MSLAGHGSGPLVRADLGAIETRLARVLEGFPPVVAAYLFGSCLERCRPGSDVDVGLVLSPGATANRDTDLLVARLSLDLGLLDGREPDLVVLNHCTEIFAFRVLSEGKLVFVGDEDALADFVETVSRAYGEVYPRYRRAREEILGGL